MITGGGGIILVFGVMCTVDVCSVLQCTVYGDVYSRCVHCVTVLSIWWCVQSMCAVCYSAQYMVMCTVDVCSVLQCSVYGNVYSRCVQCVTVHSIWWCVQSMCAVCYSAQYMV